MEILKGLNQIIKISLFQPRCRLCGKLLVYRNEVILCKECMQEISPLNGTLCTRCGSLIAGNLVICGECILRPPAYKIHRSYTAYNETMKELIILYKYAGILGLKNLLAGYLFAGGKFLDSTHLDFIIPVPADKSRSREFDPIREMTRVYSRKRGVEFHEGNLVKVKTTEPQAGLGRTKRMKNLNGAFALKKPQKLKGKNVLLIDDVYTTGTTIKKCSEILIRANARVFALTLARSLR